MGNYTAVEIKELVTKPYGKSDKSRYRGNAEDLETFLEEVYKSDVAVHNLNILERPIDFYKSLLDIANKVPAEKREELFFGGKLRYVCAEIPAKLLFVLTTVQNRYGYIDTFLNLIHKELAKEFLSDGYLAEGFTLTDAMRIVDPNYVPLLPGQKIVNNGVLKAMLSNNRIMLLPDRFDKILSEDDIFRIEAKSDALYLNETPVKFLSSEYAGITKNVYDLSGLI